MSIGVSQTRRTIVHNRLKNLVEIVGRLTRSRPLTSPSRPERIRFRGAQTPACSFQQLAETSHCIQSRPELVDRPQMLPASCRQLQAGSLRSPEIRALRTQS